MFSPDRYVAALRFAARRHHGQLMASSDGADALPYVVHVTSVAAELAAVLPQSPGIDGDLAIPCALLHDTLEDTPTSYAELVAEFGSAVADGVQALTKNAGLPKAEQLADSLRRIERQPREIWMVKLADRITNLAPPPVHWSVDKRRAYRDEAIRIADTLGPANTALDARLRARISSYAAYLAPAP